MQEPRDRLSPSFSFGPRRRKEGDSSRQNSGRGASSPPARTQPPAPAEASPPASGPTPAAPGTFRQWVGAGRATLAIAFTDIVSSSALGAKIGDRTMNEIRRAHFRRAEGLVATHDGCVIKTMGDSVMAAFHAAAEALDFALAIHADPGDPRIRVRVGIHVGPVTVEAHDAQGTTVNYAARVVSAPKGDEIWLSSEAKGHVDQQGEPQHATLPWQTHGQLELKGFAGKHILWSVAMR